MTLTSRLLSCALLVSPSVVLDVLAWGPPGRPGSFGGPGCSDGPMPIYSHPLYVENAPQKPMPYITSAYSSLQSIQLGPDVFRFACTANSTGNAFSVVLSATTGTALSAWTTTPHWHERHYETFYPTKGRVQIWAEDQSRLLTPGDLGVVPQNKTHGFQILDPDTYFVGIQAPGGFEDFFFLIGQPLANASLNTPYVPNIPLTAPRTPPPEVLPLLTTIGDFYPNFTYEASYDFVNGSSPPSDWHVANNTLPGDFSSYFMARSWGPYYLNAKRGLYQVIQPLVTQAESGPNNFTMSTISLSLPLGSQQGLSTKGAASDDHGWHSNNDNAVSFDAVRGSSTYTLPAASYFFVEEGRLVVTVEGYPPALLTSYDQVFIPPNTPFGYYSLTSFTKVLYASGGVPGGVDSLLIQEGEGWGSAMFPLA